MKYRILYLSRALLVTAALSFLNLSTSYASDVVVEYQLHSDWGSGGMSAVVVRNNGGAVVNSWQIEWDWTGNESITSSWNADVSQLNNHVSVNCTVSYCEVKPGEAQALGFTFDYSGSLTEPTITLLLPDEEPIPKPEPEPDICSTISGLSTEYERVQDWGNGGMANVVIRNNSNNEMNCFMNLFK